MGKTNLLRETLAGLANYKKQPEDVLFVTDSEKRCTFAEFSQEADGVWYDANDAGSGDYPSPVINLCLKIVGDGWWMEREVSNGEEFWLLNEPPSPNVPHGALDLKF